MLAHLLWLRCDGTVRAALRFRRLAQQNEELKQENQLLRMKSWMG
jgi:hypothetical protein